ncbi:MAG TPA: DNA translocase FtsK, partial [Patescibacteria group bacterium]
MARRKSLIKLPFFKFKINKGTIFNIFGFIIFGSALIFLVSFIKGFANQESGRKLYQLNQILVSKFGGLSIFVPLILLFLSIHFFNTKKFKFIKPNITGGLIMIFISLIGVFQSGEIGSSIFENLKLDFSVVGAVIIMGVILIIGLVLFLDTSIDAFLIFIFTILKSGLSFIKNYLFRSFFTKDDGKQTKQDNQFIVDSKIEEKAKKFVTPSSVIMEKKDEITIKPLAQSINSTWVYPPISLLADVSQKEADRGDVNYNASIIEKTLDSFGIRARVAEVNKGPAVTQYALEITRGTKLSRITALSNDLALALAATTGQVRLEAPIPGRALVGIEIPNKRPEIVTEKHLLSSPIFTSNNDPLLVPLGLDVSGQPVAASVAK